MGAQDYWKRRALGAASSEQRETSCVCLAAQKIYSGSLLRNYAPIVLNLKAFRWRSPSDIMELCFRKACFPDICFYFSIISILYCRSLTDCWRIFPARGIHNSKLREICFSFSSETALKNVNEHLKGLSKRFRRLCEVAPAIAAAAARMLGCRQQFC